LANVNEGFFLASWYRPILRLRHEK